MWCVFIPCTPMAACGAHYQCVRRSHGRRQGQNDAAKYIRGPLQAERKPRPLQTERLLLSRRQGTTSLSTSTSRRARSPSTSRRALSPSTSRRARSPSTSRQPWSPSCSCSKLQGSDSEPLHLPPPPGGAAGGRPQVAVSPAARKYQCLPIPRINQKQDLLRI